MNASSQPGRDPKAKDPAVTRRRFIASLLGFSVVATAVGVLTPIIGYLFPPTRATSAASNRVEVGTTDDFPPGTGQVMPVGDKPAVVVNTEQGGLKAFSAICTHLACVVQWDQQRQIIWCPCHDGRFNPVNGAVISGPPPAPLPELQLTVQNDVVYVSPQAT